MATNFLTGITEEQRLIILTEILDNPSQSEKNLILERYLPGAIEDIQAAQDAVNFMAAAAEDTGQDGEDMAKLAREIAERRNNRTGTTSGVTGKKLI